VSEQIRALVPTGAAAADRVQLVAEPDTYVFRVVARDQKPVEAAQRANVAARDLVDAHTAHPAIVSGSSLKLVIVAPATAPPLQDRSRFTVAATLAFAAALGLVAVRLIRSRCRPAR
jgi:hypothetical protein